MDAQLRIWQAQVDEVKARYDLAKADAKIKYSGELCYIHNKTDLKPNMDNKNAYKEKMDAQLRIWLAQFDEIKAKYDLAKADAKIEYSDELKNLHDKKEELIGKLNELFSAGNEAWERLINGADNAANDLKTALEHTTSKFEEQNYLIPEFHRQPQQSLDPG